MKRVLLILVVGGVALLVLMQLIPINRTNPPVVREIKWNSPETKALAARACFDCHSNETKYPWYSRIAPASLLLADHVSEGREAMNFSDWDNYYIEAEEVEEAIQRGEMPPQSYLLIHSDALADRRGEAATGRGSRRDDPGRPGTVGVSRHGQFGMSKPLHLSFSDPLRSTLVALC